MTEVSPATPATAVASKTDEPMTIKFEPETQSHLRLLQGIILFILVHYFFYALGATAMFLVPLCREICLWCGAVDASKKTAVSILKRGWSLLVYPGGSREIFLTDANSTDTALVRRSGFVRLAIENGCSIVPSFVFGEKWLYKHFHFPPAITDFFLNRVRFPLLLFWGRWFSYMPLKKQLAIVYGKAIVIKQNPAPTEEEISAVQAQYEAAVRDIFERYKSRYGYSEKETLSFVKG